MAQMFALRGINIGVRKSLAGIAKDFGRCRERLSHGLPKTFADIAKDFGRANVVPWSI